MKYFLPALFACIMCLPQANAQCPTCTPMFVNTCPATGGLCEKLDTGYAHHPYTRILNFYMPKKLTDPSILSQCDGCSQVDLNSITVTGVSGLPTGVNYIISNNGYFDVANNDTLGCANFCGTPLLAGVYPVTVYLQADVTAVGTPIGNVNENNVPQSYVDTLWVLPDTTAGVSSFTYGNNGSESCDSITITLNAVLAAPTPNITRYFWTLANGQTSQLQSPGTFKFTNNTLVPDTIPITLTTIFYNYTVQDVHIGDITGGYCGDIEELTCNCTLSPPDPYVKFPLLGFNNVANYVSNQCNNVNFDNLDVSIPLGTQTLTMEMWDKDNGPPFGSADDLIGSYPLNVLLGQYNYSNNNADGYVQFDTVAGTTVTETLFVIVNPSPRLPAVFASKDTFCSGDSVLISIDTAAYYSGYTYQWYRDTVLLTAQTDSAFYTTQAGKYKAIVTNTATGCSNTSAFKTISEGQSPPSGAYIVFTGTEEYINPLPSAFTANWYYNGNLVTGHNGDVLPFLGNGFYQAEIYNTMYPLCSLMLPGDSVATAPSVGINQIAKVAYNISIAPNPNNGNFTLRFSSPMAQHFDIAIRNVIGVTVYSQELDNFSGDFNGEINISTFSKGVYVITLESAAGRENRKIVVQ